MYAHDRYGDWGGKFQSAEASDNSIERCRGRCTKYTVILTSRVRTRKLIRRLVRIIFTRH